MGPENGQVFSVGTAPIGGTEGRTRNKNYTVFGENTFFETAKIFFKTFFRFFSRPIFFGLKTANSFQCARPLCRVHRGPKRKKIAPSLTKIHFLKLQRNITLSRLFSFFGSEFFLSIGSLADKTGPQPTKWPPTPPKRPYPGPQGPQTGFNGSTFSMRSNLVGEPFAQNGP